jgi:dienelactone hydrolase
MTFSGCVSQNKDMLRFLLWVAMVGGACLAAYPQTPTPGVVHASVAVTADPANSYALYLPSTYSSARQWPVLLAFDPFARGETSVNLFHEAAEKYGFIVVGSNNSRNFQDPSAAIRLLAADIREQYATDPRRLYVTGLSGGARVASSLALACKNCISGVIANSAGLPSGGTTPAPEIADWFLVAGTTDFNYPEMLHLKEALDRNNAVSRFVVFDGPHGWMPKEFADRALAWLQLRAMAKGLTPVDKEFIGEQWDERLAEAQSAQKSGDILIAIRAYREIVVDFKTLHDVKEQETLAKSLAESDAFRKAKKNEKAALDLQDEVAMNIGNLIAGIGEVPDKRATLFTQLETAAGNATREQRQSSDPAHKNAIARGLASAFAYAVETGEQEMMKKDYFSAKGMFQACEIIEPDSAWAIYLSATAHAELGEKKEAIQELKRAMDKGLTNPKALDDTAFDRVRNEETFKQIAAKLASAPKQETTK